jgi:hypothetical protein
MRVDARREGVGYWVPTACEQSAAILAAAARANEGYSHPRLVD